jgi:hypothetical protein
MMDGEYVSGFDVVRMLTTCAFPFRIILYTLRDHGPGLRIRSSLSVWHRSTSEKDIAPKKATADCEGKQGPNYEILQK